eukprot:gene2163-7034_t
MSIAHEIGELRGIWKSGVPRDEMNTKAFVIMTRLAVQEVRKPQAEPRSQASSSVISLVHGLAKQHPGIFLWGEPHRIGPFILALVEQLVHPDEERQQKVLETIRGLLQMLRMGSARALGCFARDALALLAALSPSSSPALSAAAEFSAFEAFAALCPAQVQAADAEADTSATPGAFEPSLLHVAEPAELEWARSGLLQLCAQLHADSPQFVGAAPPRLWEELLLQLAPPVEPSLGCAAPPPLSLALHALHTLAVHQTIPAAVRSRLVHQLLCLLCRGLNLEHESRLLDAPSGGDASLLSSDTYSAFGELPPPPPPPFRTEAVDDRLGELILLLSRSHAHGRPAPPPLGSDRWLRLATPWALAASPSRTLRASLCALLATLPDDALPLELERLTPFLFRAADRRCLLPMYGRALGAETDEGPARSLPDGPPEPAADGDGDAGAEERRAAAKRRRVRGVASGGGLTLRAQLLRLATDCDLPMSAEGAFRRDSSGQSQALVGEAGGGAPSLAATHLGFVGAVFALLVRADLARAEADRRLRPRRCTLESETSPQLAQLLTKVQSWLGAVVATARRRPEDVGSQSDCDGAAELDVAAGPATSSLGVALDVGCDLLRLCSCGGAQILEPPPDLVGCLSSLAALPWAPPDAGAAGPLAWATRFSLRLRRQCLGLLAVLPPHASTEAAKAARTAAFLAALAPPTRAEAGEPPSYSPAALATLRTALAELPRLTLAESTAAAAAAAAAAAREGVDAVRAGGPGRRGPAAPSSVLAFCAPLEQLASQCPAPIVSDLAECIGRLSCLDAGQATLTAPPGALGVSGPGCAGRANSGCGVALGAAHAPCALVCRACDDPPPSERCACDPNAADEPTEPKALFGLVPALWGLHDGTTLEEAGSRAAVVRCIARLARHAAPIQLARSKQDLIRLIQLVGDPREAVEVVEAGEEDGAAAAGPRIQYFAESWLPRLLGYPPFLRSVLSLAEDAPLTPSVKMDLLMPMAGLMNADGRDALAVLRTMGATVCQPLYSEDECLASAVIAFAEVMGRNDPSSA